MTTKYIDACDIVRGDVVVLEKAKQIVDSYETVQQWTILRFVNGLKAIFPNHIKLTVASHIDLVPQETIDQIDQSINTGHTVRTIDEAIDALRNFKKALKESGLVD